jgi:hypothetical protein
MLKKSEGDPFQTIRLLLVLTRRREEFMKRVSPLLACMRVICLLSLALALSLVLAYARSTVGRGGSSKGSKVVALQMNQPLAPIPLGVFVADDMPITLTGPTVSGDRFPQLRFQVRGKGLNNIQSLTFAFFDFDEKGLLRRVASWARSIDLTETAGPTEITINLERQLTPQHRHVLAVEQVRSGSVTWQAQFPSLGRAANQVSAGQPAPVATVGRTEKALPDDSGSVLCSNGFRKAMLLAQLGDGQSVTSFRCDENNRSFSFTFNGKDLSH